MDEKKPMTSYGRSVGPKLAFILVSFSLGELGDGLNIFQGIYLVGIGWNEGSVGLALSLMGLTALIVQPWAGDWVDKTPVDRRLFLAVASAITALSASMVLFVRPGNVDHMLIFISKVIEGVSSSFIGPCLAALTLATFGPRHFDSVMASNILWGHVGSVVAAILAGLVAFFMYPDTKFCFLVIGASGLLALVFAKQLPTGDQLMGRGFEGKFCMDEQGHLERLDGGDIHDSVPGNTATAPPPEPVGYWEIFSSRETTLLCATGFFFHFANANVLLVLGELMGQDGQGQTRSAIPLTAGAIVTAQLTMAITTWAYNRMNESGMGRKPLFLLGLGTLPTRCALIILLVEAGDFWLLGTQLLDGIGGGACGLIHPLLVADITFGTGRFNVVMGLTASFFGLGATLSNLLGQLVVEKYGHIASLTGSLALSFIPILLFSFMPETLGHREATKASTSKDDAEAYKSMT